MSEKMMTVIEEIAAERKRQVEAEGWTPEHDDQHEDGELLRAGVLYYHHAIGSRSGSYPMSDPPVGWPWAREWWKPKNPRRDLIRAGALCKAEEERLTRRNPSAYCGHIEHKLQLIVAEIERLDCAEAKQS